MNRVFDAPFRQTLGEILRSAPRLRRGRDAEVRTRRRMRSESGTFSGHRAYVEGDDLRNLDWNVYARTDELFLKQLEDEDKVGLTLVLDRSASMTADDRWPGALRLAAILGGLGLVQLDGVHIVWGAGQAATFEGVASLGRLLEQLEGLAIGEEAPLVLAQQVIERGGGGRLDWISDFAHPESFAPALAALRKHGSQCSGWLPALPTDRVPAAAGFVRFRDPETGHREVLQVDGALRAAMAKELGRLRAAQDAAFKAVGYPLVRFDLPPAGDLRVAAWTGRGRIYRL